MPLPQVAAERFVLGRDLSDPGKLRLRHAHAGERRWLQRERLRRRRPLAWCFRLRDGTFLDAVDGSSCLPVEHEQQAHLGDLGDGRDQLAVVAHVDECRRGAKIEIPDVVMDRLVVPDHVAGHGIDRDDRIRIQVVAMMRTAPIVVASLGDRREEHAAIGVDRHDAPDVGAADWLLPAVVQPCRLVRVARLRDEFRLPQLPARSRIVGLDVRPVVLDHHDVAVDRGRRRGCAGVRHDAVLAKGRDRLTRLHARGPSDRLTCA